MKSKLIAFVCRLFLPAFGCLILSVSAHGAFLQKKFVVAHDQGRDVLCDSYVVKKNDYVTKLLQQRGEIAYRDFPKFLEIFQRLNPSVENIDLIYPNQRLLVPLRIIPPNSLEGQASGTVTIPLITITNIPEGLKQNSMNYVVQEGDTVSALIARKFGRYSSRPYKEAVKIFKFLNPQIKDINFIHVGQAINIPVSTVRDETWYPDIFNDTGELVIKDETTAKETPPPVEKIEEFSAPDEPEALPVTAEISDKTLQPPEEPKPEPVVEKKVEKPKEEKPKEEKPKETVETKTPEEKKAKVPTASKPVMTPLPSIFKKAAEIFGADLLNTGEYFFPRPGQEDLGINLAATPVMEFASGLRILFAKHESLPPADQKVVSSFWKKSRIVTMSYDAPLRELLYTVCQILNKNGCDNNFSVTDRNVTANITAELIYDNLNGPGKVCVSLIDGEGQKMPDEISHFFKDKGLIISEWINRENFFGPVSVGNAAQPKPGYFLAPDMSSPKAFVKDFAAVFGLDLQENVEISFPYAGFQVKAYSNLLSVAPGKDLLVDFGDLQGDAIKAIETTGFKVLQMGEGRSYSEMVSKLLAVMPVSQSDAPVFWAANRPRTYNAAIRVHGRLVTMIGKKGKIRELITDMSPADDIMAFLNQAGIHVVKINNP